MQLCHPLVRSVLITLLFFAGAATGQDLREYVQAKDPAFAVTSERLVEEGDGLRLYRVGFDSLRWRDAFEVIPGVWHHNVLIAVPDQLRSDKVFLHITGGHLLEAQDSMTGLLQEMARELGMVVAELHNIPNQPLLFTGNPLIEVEDGIIAWSWQQFLKDPDPTWLAQYPQTKAAVAGMDVVEEFVIRHTGTAPGGFINAGASKRGWTTWLTAVADPRVIAIAPMVIDVLNAVPSMKHHNASLGFWSEAVGDYVRHGVMDRIDTPEVDQLLALIDPWEHRAQLTLPKLMINAANDQFFLPDSSLFYYDDLPGAKYLRYNANHGHGLSEAAVGESLVPFVVSLVHGEPMPAFTWEYNGEQEVLIRTDPAPALLRVWEAVNPDARDFRAMDEAVPVYRSRDISIPPAPDATRVRVEAPERGWKSWFVEAVWSRRTGPALHLSTQARVIPADAL